MKDCVPNGEQNSCDPDIPPQESSPLGEWVSPDLFRHRQKGDSDVRDLSERQAGSSVSEVEEGNWARREGEKMSRTYISKGKAEEEGEENIFVLGWELAEIRV